MFIRILITFIWFLCVCFSCTNTFLPEHLSESDIDQDNKLRILQEQSEIYCKKK